MSILPALTALTVREAAIAFAAADISVIPLNGKKAHIHWEPFQHRCMSTREAAFWWGRNPSLNIGIVLGSVSSGLVCIDLDGIEASNRFWFQFPHYQNTLVVKTGSGNGYHCYYKVREVPATVRAMDLPEGNIELRSNGAYVVGPNGIHPDTGQRYEISNLREPLEMDDLCAVVEWISSLQAAKRVKPVTGPKPVTPPSRTGLRTMRFAEAALSGEVDSVRNAPAGNQNNRLNIAAYNLGQLVGDGMLTETQVENALCQAAMGFSDQDQAQNLRTIQSGMRAGIRNPRSTQTR